MNTKYIRLLCGAIVLAGATASVNAHAQWKNYSTFGAALINPNKWNVLEPGGDGRWLQEVDRYVSGGLFNMSLRSNSEPDTDTGTTKTRNRLYIAEAKQVGLVAMRLDLVVKKTKARACANNPDPTAARFLLENTYFNAGGSSGVGDATGDVYSYIEARFDESSPSQNPIAVVARALRCEDASCSTTTQLFSQTLATTGRNQKMRLQSIWAQNNSKIKFQVRLSNGTVSRATYAYANDLVVAGPPAKRDQANGFQLRNEVPNCDMTLQTKTPQARLQVTVDNIQLKKL